MFVRIILAASVMAAAFAQDQPKVEVEKVNGNIYMLKGQGGNIGLCIGEDGAFLIDDQYAPATPAILEAVKSVEKQPIKFVINTHWHSDHTGGNENLGKEGTIIFAHENVRNRMSTKQFMKAFNAEVQPSPKAALPVVTFTRDIAFHLNGETIKATHYAHAHTDGDTVIHFEKADVVHMGDIYFNGMFPFIDGGSGGSVDGMIAAVKTVHGMISDSTKIIPGHGPISNKKELKAYHDMLVEVRDNVKRLKDGGKTVEETIEAKPAAAYETQLGDGFFKTHNFISFVYETVK